jgi:hypothetical protein
MCLTNRMCKGRQTAGDGGFIEQGYAEDCNGLRLLSHGTHGVVGGSDAG